MEQNLNRAVESMVSAKPDYTGEIIAIIRSPISPSVMRERLEDYHEKDIAEVLPALTSAERKKLYRILEPDMLSNILERVEGAEANTYLIEMDLRKAARRWSTWSPTPPWRSSPIWTGSREAISSSAWMRPPKKNLR